MAEALLAALAALLSFDHMVYMLLGVSVGLVVGVIPGLGGIAGLSLLMPFLYGLDKISALGMLIGLVAVIPTSDTFSSVLLGIPGSSASQATVLDGFPLAKRGQAARALSAAFISSMFGGVLGAAVLTAFVVIARPLILMFGSAELFMLALFGLSMVATLAGRSLPKGLLACCVGLLIGTFGGAPATGEFRMTFGVDYLYDGIPIVIVGLGLFAIPEISDLLRRNSAISDHPALGTGWFSGIIDWWHNLWLSVRCAGLGCLIGAIPGLGGSVVDWIAYSHAVQTTKNAENYGKGDIRGVIAPESANNAMQGGALLPTLLFGIPGSGAMAVFMGGMVLFGIEPGPSMVQADLNVTYSLIWSLALANIFGAGICLLLALPISRLAHIQFRRLAPFMIVLICFAAFQATRDLADLVSLLALGLVGILMKRFGWPRPALLIGFVLAPQTETYFYQAVQLHGWSFVQNPGVIIIGLLAIASVYFGLRNRIDDHGERGDIHLSWKTHGSALRAVAPQMLFVIAAIGFLLIGLWDAADKTFLGKVFPMSVAGVGLIMGGWLLFDLTLKQQAGPAFFDTELRGFLPDQADKSWFWGGIAWIGLLVAGSALVGFYLAMLIFFVAFLILRARESWLMTCVLTLGISGFILLMAWLLSLYFPAGMLQSYFELPWPFN